MTGVASDGSVQTVHIVAEGSPVANYAFDVTPGRLVTGLITEAGICAASRAGIAGLFPDRAAAETPSSARRPI